MSLITDIAAQESNDNYDAENPNSGAKGKYQIMPENWAKWAEEAGIGSDAPMSPQNQDTVASYKLNQYKNELGSDALAAVAWYAGYDYARKMRDGEQLPFDPDAPQSNGSPSVNEYVRQVLNKHSEGSDPLMGAFNTGKDVHGASPAAIPAVEPVYTTRWQESKDKFLENFYDSTFGSAVRLLWTNLTTGQRDSDGKYYPPDWRPTQQDVDYAVKMLPGDYTAQKFALMNARSPEHLAILLQMKKEDAERQERVASYGWGLSSLASAAGILADPVNLLPVGMEATGLKVLSRLFSANKAVQALSVSKIAKFSEIAAQNSGLMAANAYGAEKFGGFQQDYTHSALMGAVAGGGLSFLSDFLKGAKVSRDVDKVVGSLENMETTAITHAADMKAYNEIHSNTKDSVAPLHDPQFHVNTGSETLSKLIDNGQVFVVAKEAIKDLGRKLGVNIPEDAKAFHVPNENYTVLIKDNLKPTDNIDNILAHEVGVHAGLQSTLGDKAYNAIMDTVSKRVQNPQGIWKNAVKASPGGGLEEVLGHFIENAPANDKIFSKVRANINKGLRSLGLTKDFTDGEIKDFVKRSLQNQLEKAQGYHTLSDGTAVWGNLKYSAANLFNPNNMAHVYALDHEVTKATQGELPWWLPKVAGKSLEAGKWFGTISGILGNSVSNMARSLTPTLFHDARMRGEAGNLVMPAEKMKDFLKTQLNSHWATYMDIRNKYLWDNKLENKMGFGNGVRQDFNSQVREAYNAKYANNNNGVLEVNWHPDVLAAAQTLKNLRDAIVEYGKKSSEMFGTAGKNLIDKEWKPLDEEIWRVIDEDKWVSFMDKFPSMDKAQEWLYNYAAKYAKRDIMEQKLMTELTKEWETKQAQWEKDHVKYKKDLDLHEMQVEKIKEKEKARYDKILGKWQEKVDAWKEKVKSLPKGATPPAKPGKPPKPAPTPLPKEPKRPLEPIKPTEVSQDELDAYIQKEAHDWAYGITDRDNSELEHVNGENGHMNFMRERFPMDTTSLQETPWGETVSFDSHLRDDNFDRIVPKVIDRFAGEAAFRNVFENPQLWDKARATIQSQLDHAVQHKQMTQAQHDKELQVLDDGVAMLRGTHSSQGVQGLWDAFGRTAMNLSYAQNGANMGFNQLGEVGGAIAYTGGRALLHILPSLNDIVKTAMHGKETTTAIKDAEYKLFGDTLENRIWSSNYESRIYKDASQIGSRMRIMDKLNEGITYASKMVSSINMLPALTDRMIRGARADTIGDAIRWADGEQFSRFRNPFSEFKLKAAGVDQALADSIKGDINKYITRNAEGKPVDFKLDNWQHENPETFFKFRTIIDNQAMRAIQQNTIGNKNVLKDANTFTKMMFQFKDFTLKAVNGQTLRALTSKEWDDGLAAMYAMAMNMGVYALLTRLRADANFSDDNQKRKDYLESRLSPQKLANAALIRGALTGSFLSFVQDIYDAYTGGQGFRTTVERTQSFQGKKAQPPDRSTSQVLGSYITQLPAIRAIKAVGWDAPNAMVKAALPGEHETKRDLQNLYRSLPLQNFLPMVYLSGKMIGNSGLPEKDGKARQLKEQ